MRVIAYAVMAEAKAMFWACVGFSCVGMSVEEYVLLSVACAQLPRVQLELA